MYKESTGGGVWSVAEETAASPRVIALFANDPESALRAVRHLREGSNGIPVWLYSTVQPPPGLAAVCDRVAIHRSSFQLLLTAQRELWPKRAALAVGIWTGRGTGLLKLCPFLVPPFRSLFLNRSGDFLPGTPLPVAAHCHHLFRERAHDIRVRAGEIASDAWHLVRHHIWRSAPVTSVKDYLSAASLRTAATLLSCSGYPHRRLFTRLHGSQPLTLSTPATHDARAAVCFEQHGHDWDSAALSRVARSNARWIVWHNGSGPGTTEDLLPLFDDPATFAVSRQSSFRAWKPGLFPTAPFRALQPGERTRVLAPLGSTIVVDRRKLEALGVPDVSHPITAWMLLFWKAAAAGWTCYSAGREGSIKAQSDFPTEEAEFLWHVARDPELRALGPRDALLARGNVAFSADHTASITSPKPRVLVVSPFLPYPLSHGGAVRMYNLCRALSNRVDFALVAVREHQEVVDYPKLHEVFREVRIVDLDQIPRGFNDLPQAVLPHECPSLRAAIAGLCRTWQPDIAQFEYTQTAALRDAAQGIPTILVEHDVTFCLYEQLARTTRTRESRREHQRWVAFENRWLAEHDAVWTMSESDRILAVESSGRDAARTFPVPNGVDTRRFAACPDPNGRPEILYVGSFRHLPNLLAFDHLRNTIMPLVWERFPEAVLRVVAGPRHQYFWKQLAPRSLNQPVDERIVLHDFVEDLRPLYAQSTVVVAPLLVSAGTNIKVLEAMACGRPVVSTTTGCAGLDLEDGRDLLIRDQTPEFAGAVCALLSGPELRYRIAAQARRTAETRFSWDAIAESAWQSYCALSPSFR